MPPCVRRRSCRCFLVQRQKRKGENLFFFAYVFFSYTSFVCVFVAEADRVGPGGMRDVALGRQNTFSLDPPRCGDDLGGCGPRCSARMRKLRRTTCNERSVKRTFQKPARLHLKVYCVSAACAFYIFSSVGAVFLVFFLNFLRAFERPGGGELPPGATGMKASRSA